MSRTARLALAGVLLACVPHGLPARQPDDLKPLIDKIIKAYGGEEKLGKVKAVAYTRKTILTKDGKESVQKVTIQFPAHFRSETEYEVDGKKKTQVFVHLGN